MKLDQFYLMIILSEGMYCLMKVCIVNTNFSLGGVQKVAVDIANGLSKEKGYEVSLFNFYGDGIVFYEIEKEVNIFNNVRVKTFLERIIHKYFTYRYKLIGKTYQLSSCVKNGLKGLTEMIEKREFDCLILCQGLLTTLAPKLKEKFPHLKVIAWQHSAYEVYIQNYCAPFLDEYLQGLLKSDHIVCLTRHFNESFKSHNSSTTYIYNPVTIKNEQVSRLDNNTVVFVGRLIIETKGLDYLVSIAEKVSSKWKWKLAGNGVDEEEFKRLVFQKELEKTIELVGPLSGDDLVNHYLGGSIYASTSRWEGLSLVLLEAMSCGLPIISFDIPGTREMLDDGKCGVLIEKYNLDHFAKEVDRLMNNKCLREQYQRKGLERIKDFSLEKIIMQWKNLIAYNYD